jgi:hypothetical protein
MWDMLTRRRTDRHRAGLDPSFYIVHVAEGRWLIQQGDLEGAKQQFLDAVAANPQVAESSLGSPSPITRTGRRSGAPALDVPSGWILRPAVSLVRGDCAE